MPRLFTALFVAYIFLIFVSCHFTSAVSAAAGIGGVPQAKKAQLAQISSGALEAIRNDDPENTLYFWQLTDPHVDADYKEGSDPYCDVPLCCRENKFNQTASAGFWAFSVTNAQTQCDIPPHTFKSALEFIASFPVKSEFVVYGGDNLHHADWIYTREMNLAYNKLIHQMLAETFQPLNVPVISTLGNHETYPVNQLDLPPNGDWFLSQYVEALKPWIGADAAAVNSTRVHGSYSLRIRDGLRVISYNTQYCNPQNFYLWRSSKEDPTGMLAFVESQLALAEKAGERVLIVGHIPPGHNSGATSSSQTAQCNKRFTQILERFQKSVIASVYGHTHQDYFVLFRNEQGQGSTFSSVALVTPAVTPFDAGLPSVRLFKIDKRNYELIDFVTFYTNVTEANLKHEKSLTWQMEYSMRDAFEMMDLTPASFGYLLQKLDKDDKVWEKFRMYHNTMNQNAWGKDRKTRHLALCKMAEVDATRHTECALL